VKRVMAAQARLSDDLHSSAQALNPEAVSLDELTNEVKALEDWIQSIRDRRFTRSRSMPAPRGTPKRSPSDQALCTAAQ
jgi:hypothetical protein